MFRRASLCAVTACFALIATGTLSAENELLKAFKERRVIMFNMQSAYWPLLKVKRGESTDLAAAAVAAQFIEDALDRFSALLLPGTAKGGEVLRSRAKPEIWTEPAEFAAALDTLQAAAAALSDAATSGDIDLFKTRFDTFAGACVGCHDLKPSGGGRFRAPL